MNVKIKRIMMKLTQKELADMVDTSNNTIIKIEKGDFNSVKLGTLKKIAKVLNSTFEELFLADEQEA